MTIQELCVRATKREGDGSGGSHDVNIARMHEAAKPLLQVIANELTVAQLVALLSEYGD